MLTMFKSYAAGITIAAFCGFCLAHVGFIGTAHTADPTVGQLAMEISTLKTRINQLESRVLPKTGTASSASSVDTALAILQKDVAAMKQVLQVSASSVTLKSAGALVLQAGGQASLEAVGALKLKSASSTELDAAKIELKSSGIATIRGTTISLNNGSRPVAFLGGRTAGNAASQLITDGSTSVLVP